MPPKRGFCESCGVEMLNLALTSDFPSTANQAVIDRMRGSVPSPRVAWIPPLTGMGRERFPAAQRLFESYGFPVLLNNPSTRTAVPPLARTNGLPEMAR